MIIREVRQKQTLPSPGELRLLQLLWRLGAGSADDIVKAHPSKSRPNYKTTLSILRIMERKKYIKHAVKGRTFIFRPVVSRQSVDNRFVQALVKQNFRGSASHLFVHLLETKSLPAGDIEKLEAFLREP